MSIYVGDKKAKLYRGDYGPAQMYKGDVKIAGYTDVEKVGTSISGVETYNDALNLTIEGVSEQAVTPNSPSPDYPSPIRSSESFDVVSCGRNFIDFQDTTIVITNTYYKDSATGFTLHPNTRYTLSFDYVINSTTGEIFAGIGFGVNSYTKDIVVGARYPNQTAGRTVATFNSGDIGFDKKLFVRFVRAITRVTANVDISNVQLEFGTTATPYQPYHAATAHITDPLRSVGDVSDSIEGSNGKVELVQRCATKMFDQSTPVSQNSAGDKKLFYIRLPELRWEMQKYGDGLCTHCKNTYSVNPTTDYLSCSFGAWGPTMYLMYRNDTSVKEIEAYLTQQSTAGTPVTCQYQLATPTRTDITATPLGQALLAMRTYPHYTQVYTNATLPPTLRAKIKEMEP